MTRSRSSVAVRLAGCLLRLYPRAFRARYGADVEAALMAMDSATDMEAATREVGHAGTLSGTRLVLDVLITLFRAWWWRLRVGLSEGGSRGSGSGEPGPRKLAELRLDIRYALRVLSRDRAYGAIAIATLAVAIGCNAAVFSVAYSVLLRTLPYDAPERTVRVEPSPATLAAGSSFAVPETLVGIAQVEATAVFTEDGSGSLASDGLAQAVRVTHVSPPFFEVLGASLVLGAGFAGDGDGNRVVLSYELWQRAFAGDPGIVGRTIRLSGNPLVVVGVAAPEVDYPGGTEVWVTYPLMTDLLGAASGGEVIARLTNEAAMDEVRALHEARMRERYASFGEALPDARIPQLVPLRASLVGPVGDSLVLLFAASTLVLLLGCANLAGLAVARHAGRAADLAVRRALGASRARLVRMVFVETLSLALAAGALSVAIAGWGRSALANLLPADVPGLDRGGLGLETLAFVLLAVVVTGLVTGLLPALQSTTADVKVGDAGISGRIAERRRRLHPGLVAAQVGLAIVLAVAATLMARSVVNLRSVPLGFATEDVVTFEVRLPRGLYDDLAAYRRFAGELRAALAEQPGISTVGFSSRMPLSDGMGVALHVWPEMENEDASDQTAMLVHTSPEYFGALEVPIVAGRGMLRGAAAAGTVVLSQDLARKLFGRESVAGQRVRVRRSARGEPETRTITGVVGDVRQRGFENDVADAIYVPFEHQPVPWISFAVRTDRAPADVGALVRAALAGVDPSLAPLALQTMRSAVGRRTAARDALALVSVLFGAAAVALALLGIHGLVAQSVVRRRREMGVRLAVGARAGHLLAMVLRDAVRIAGIGVGAGLLASLLATRLLASFLWGVAAWDALTYAFVALTALVATLCASLPPARRAARVDPLESLRTG